MLELREMKFPGQPFPQAVIGSMLSPNEVMQKTGMTQKQMSWALQQISGDSDSVTINDRWIITIEPKFLRDLAVDENQKTYGYEMGLDEIGEALGLAHGTVYPLYERAKKKLIENGKMKRFLYAVSELRKIRANRPLTVTTETRTTVTIQ